MRPFCDEIQKWITPLCDAVGGYMSYCVGIVLGYFLYFRNHSKIIYGFAFLYACIIFGLNYQNPDYFAYQRIYYGWKNSELFSASMESGFKFLCEIGQILGLDYQEMCCIFGLIGLTLISKTIIDYSPYPNLVFLIYLLYPFPIDVVQIRSFLATAVFVFSIRYIIEYQKSLKKWNILYAFLCLIIAISFHKMAILLLGIIFVIIVPKGNQKLYWGALVLLVPAAIYVLPIISPYMQELIPFFAGKIRRWISIINFTTVLHLLRIVVVRGAFVALCALAKRISRISADRNNEGNIYNRTLWSFFLGTIVISIILEGFFAAEFERVSRAGLIIGYILITRYAYKMSRDNRTIVFAGSLIFGVSYFIDKMFIQSFGYDLNYFTVVFRQVFEHNLLFDQLDLLFSL